MAHTIDVDKTIESMIRRRETSSKADFYKLGMFSSGQPDDG